MYRSWGCVCYRCVLQWIPWMCCDQDQGHEKCCKYAPSTWAICDYLILQSSKLGHQFGKCISVSAICNIFKLVKINAASNWALSINFNLIAEPYLEDRLYVFFKVSRIIVDCHIYPFRFDSVCVPLPCSFGIKQCTMPLGITCETDKSGCNQGSIPCLS